MKRTQLPLYSDTLFTYLATFLFAVCLFTYLEFPRWATLSASAVCALALAVLVFLWLRGRLEAKYLLAKDEEVKNKLMLHLTLDKTENNKRLFSKLLKAEGTPAERKNGALFTEGNYIFLLFSMQPVSADEIAKLIKKETDGKKTVYCNALSPEAEKLCKEFSVEFVSGRDLYLRLKEQSLLPKEYICPSIPKRTAREKISSFFRKSLAHPYFLAAASLLTFSFFTSYRLYYLIAGSLLLLLSLSLRLFGSRVKA